MPQHFQRIVQVLPKVYEMGIHITLSLLAASWANDNKKTVASFYQKPVIENSLFNTKLLTSIYLHNVQNKSIILNTFLFLHTSQWLHIPQANFQISGNSGVAVCAVRYSLKLNELT